MRADRGRPYWCGFSEAQWTSFSLACLVLICEEARILPATAWHSWAAAGMLGVMATATIRRATDPLVKLGLLHSQHVSEVVEATQLIASQSVPSWKGLPRSIVMARTSRESRSRAGGSTTENAQSNTIPSRHNILRGTKTRPASSRTSSCGSAQHLRRENLSPASTMVSFHLMLPSVHANGPTPNPDNGRALGRPPMNAVNHAIPASRRVASPPHYPFVQQMCASGKTSDPVADCGEGSMDPEQGWANGAEPLAFSIGMDQMPSRRGHFFGQMHVRTPNETSGF